MCCLLKAIKQLKQAASICVHFRVYTKVGLLDSGKRLYYTIRKIGSEDDE